MGPSARRQLLFERLERRRCTAAWLIAVAPLSDAEQVELEHWLAEHQAPPRTDSVGQLSPDSRLLLRFVEQQAPGSSEPATAYRRPTAERCEAADRWLRLEAADVRAILISETMHSRTASEQ